MISFVGNGIFCARAPFPFSNGSLVGDDEMPRISDIAVFSSVAGNLVVFLESLDFDRLPFLSYK